MGSRCLSGEVRAEGGPGVGGNDTGRRDAVVGLELAHSLCGHGSEVAARGLHAQGALDDRDGLSAIGLLEHRGLAGRSGSTRRCGGGLISRGLLDLRRLGVDVAVRGSRGLDRKRNRLLAEGRPREGCDLAGGRESDRLLVFGDCGLRLGTEVAGRLDVERALGYLDHRAVVAFGQHGQVFGGSGGRTRRRRLPGGAGSRSRGGRGGARLGCGFSRGSGCLGDRSLGQDGCGSRAGRLHRIGSQDDHGTRHDQGQGRHGDRQAAEPEAPGLPGPLQLALGPPVRQVRLVSKSFIPHRHGNITGRSRSCHIRLIGHAGT